MSNMIREAVAASIGACIGNPGLLPSGLSGDQQAAYGKGGKSCNISAP
jgi:hypothetical protein